MAIWHKIRENPSIPLASLETKSGNEQSMFIYMQTYMHALQNCIKCTLHNITVTLPKITLQYMTAHNIT